MYLKMYLNTTGGNGNEELKVHRGKIKKVKKIGNIYLCNLKKVHIANCHQLYLDTFLDTFL